MNGLDKEDVEWFVCSQFLRLYLESSVSSDEVAKRESPDFAVRDAHSGQTFGLEITDAIFQSERDLEARKSYLREDTIVDLDNEDWQEKFKSVMGSPKDTAKNTNLEITRTLHRAIMDKLRVAEKYDYDDRMILCVRWANPIFTKLRDYVTDIGTLPSSRFSEIWIAGFHGPELSDTYLTPDVDAENGVDNCYGIYEVYPGNRVIA